MRPPFPASSISYRRKIVSPMDFSPFVWLRSDLGITLVGSKVSVWADQSGNANDFVQTTDALRPTYVASNANFNNHPSLTFSTNVLTSLATIVGGYANVTLLAIHRPTSVVSAVLLETGTFAVNDMQLQMNGPTVYGRGATGIDQAQSDVADVANARTHRAFRVPFGSLTTENPDNFRAGQIVPSTMVSNTATNGALATKTWFLGGFNATPTAPYPGSIVEFVAFPSLLSPANIGSLYTGYSAPRYGA